MSSGLRWTSNLVGQIGTGASFSRTLTAGTHTITATVTDSGGMSGSRQVSMTVTVATTPPAATGPAGTLSARATQVRNKTKVDLSWSGLSGSRADIYRNGSRVSTQNNGGSYTDSPNGRGGSYTYRVCVAGTSTCTNDASVSY